MQKPFVFLVSCGLFSAVLYADSTLEPRELKISKGYNDNTQSYVAPQLTKITLEECINLARANYPLAKNTKLLDETLSLNLQKINFGLIPRVKLNSKISYQSDVTSLPFSSDVINNMAAASGMHINYKPLTRDQYQFTFEIAQPVFDWNTMVAQKAVTKAQTNTSKASVENELYKVQQSVINVYFALLLVDLQLKQSDIHLKELEKNHKYIESLYQNGVAYQDDVDKILIEILNAKRNKDTLLSQQVTQLKTLSQLTARNMQNFNLKIPNIDECILYLREIAASFDKDENSFFNNRPELRYYSLQQNEIEVQKKLDTAKDLPYIDVFFQAGYSNPGLNILNSGFQPYYITGLRLSWDFSNLYSKHQQNEIAAKQKLQINSQNEQFILNAKISLIQSIKTAQNILNQLDEYDKIIALQERIVENSETKLLNGVLGVNDLLTDVNNLNLTKLDANYQKMEFLNQVYNIKQAQNLWQNTIAQDSNFSNVSNTPNIQDIK